MDRLEHVEKIAQLDHVEKIAQLVLAGWTHQKIADVLGVSVRSVYRWANGTSTPLPLHRRQLLKLKDTRNARP